MKLTPTSDHFFVAFVIEPRPGGKWAACCIDERMRRSRTEDRRTKLLALADMPDLMQRVTDGVKFGRESIPLTDAEKKAPGAS